ncbi:MAG: hypothetical protein BWY29_00861 [Microgenomates group bacterium ADurb.Bin238]|nr:MAG: hypothetical protein BWY29_00861 [Microgenomates group bacterium ADurb.Bin238]
MILLLPTILMVLWIRFRFSQEYCLLLKFCLIIKLVIYNSFTERVTMVLLGVIGNHMVMEHFDSEVVAMF